MTNYFRMVSFIALSQHKNVHLLLFFLLLNGNTNFPLNLYQYISILLFCLAFRFYFDGLIVNFIRKPSPATPPFPFDAEQKRLVVMTQTTEKSFQVRNLRMAMAEANQSWPELMSKLGAK